MSLHSANDYHALPDTDQELWEAVTDAVEDAINNGDGRLFPSCLWRALTKAGIEVRMKGATP